LCLETSEADIWVLSGGSSDHLEMASESPRSVVTSSSAAASAGTSGVLDQLERLANLHAQGALTDAELAAEKAKILGSA
jgi:hypothetical protein